ncbi:hypothetical protein GCM10007304_17860 [Rhodococcoides trifolii]|uniref:Uncharacterized protein n=1 Tax=Rhodococcoides trifolii TaxID=908250 RepID=A0A917D039_9NOCA|nr:hypothetical protein [Rhodococcus trifolii]GGG04153.1 hypothetical protein GCM10007304_17860 [Rhodococcus trifolii]
MTAAGVASTAFIGVLVVLYGGWTYAAWIGWRCRYDYAETRYLVTLAMAFWIIAHGLFIIIVLITAMVWLGTVAGWW